MLTCFAPQQLWRTTSNREHVFAEKRYKALTSQPPFPLGHETNCSMSQVQRKIEKPLRLPLCPFKQTKSVYPHE